MARRLLPGFAGSIATYASWENQSFQAVSGFKSPGRSWLHNVGPLTSLALAWCPNRR